MPSTRPGSISGDAMKVAIALLAGTKPRTTAMAHSVPSSSEMQVEKNAICAESQTAETSVSFCATASYQRSDNPVGGNAKIADGENETATTIRIGANRNIRTRASMVQQKPMP